jgi:hypothetical protein
MSRLITGISGALALSLISGAAVFASSRDFNRDLGRGLSAVAGDHTTSTQSPSSSTGDVSLVNRGSKADRAAGPAGSPASARTVSLQLNGVLDTTFLVRIPAAAANPPAAASSSARPAIRKPMVACEPAVSVLVEGAKQLQPGSCLT